MKKSSILLYIFPLVGLLALGLSVYLYFSTVSFLDHASEGQGVVIKLEYRRSSDSSSYYPRVKFQTSSGEEVVFTSSSGSNPARFHVGEKVAVLYLENNPQDAKINTFISVWLGTIVVFVLGVSFTGVGLVTVIGLRKHNKMIEFLNRHGTTILAQFQNVEEITRRSHSTHRHSRRSIRTSRTRNSYKIIAQWQNPNTQSIHLFESEAISYDPTQYLEGIDIPVIIDPNDPKRYYINLDFLPKLA